MNEERKLLIAILKEMEATRGWYFRCLQPHSKSIAAARKFLKRRADREYRYE